MAVQSPLIELKMRKEDANDPQLNSLEKPMEKTDSNKRAQGLTLDCLLSVIPIVCAKLLRLAFTLSWENCFLLMQTVRGALWSTLKFRARRVIFTPNIMRSSGTTRGMSPLNLPFVLISKGWSEIFAGKARSFVTPATCWIMASLVECSLKAANKASPWCKAPHQSCFDLFGSTHPSVIIVYTSTVSKLSIYYLFNPPFTYIYINPFIRLPIFPLENLVVSSIQSSIHLALSTVGAP